ncbi:MAG: hypothetical protein QW743_08640, partial [Candidatus Methanomethylicia archaeon]
MKEKVEVKNTTVPVYKYEEDGSIVYEFDTSMTGPPEPMVNALAVLELLTSPNIKVIMINHRKPMGLFDKLEDRYNVEIEDLPDGKYKIM